MIHALRRTMVSVYQSTGNFRTIYGYQQTIAVGKMSGEQEFPKIGAEISRFTSRSRYVDKIVLKRTLTPTLKAIEAFNNL